MKALIDTFHPKHIFIALDKIDNEAPSHILGRKDSMRRVFWTLATVSVCLLLIHYLKNSYALVVMLRGISVLTGEDVNHLHLKLRTSDFAQLISYGWWTGWHIVGYLLIPYIVNKFLIKESFVDMGWRFNDTGKHWRAYIALISPILFFIFLVSFREDFLNHYPFYKLAHRSWFDFIAWEVLYLTQFICLEFFFRGFFLNALRPALGANAIWVMCVPYLMIHFPKLWPEATGAILFGLFLGILALQSRSIWGGFMVHAGIAITMDLASMFKQGKIPTQWWLF